MKKIFALVLSFLLVLPCLLTALPMGAFAAGGEVIKETTSEYTDSLGYGGYIVRAKSDGSIMLSPFISALKSAIDGGANISDYTIEMTFTLLEGKNGKELKTYNTVSAAINTSNGAYFDIYLNGTKGSVGFCPIAGEFYNIKVDIFKHYGTANEEKVLYGTYLSAEIPTTIKTSKYYTPDSKPVDYTISLSYSFNNDLKGSAAGSIYVKSNAPGTFKLKWGNANGEPLSTKVGEKTLPYSPLAQFDIENKDGGEYVYKVLGFTAIPVGAKKLLITDTADKVLKSIDLPADKLLEETDPEYSFGVVSDVHFNYFFDSTKTIDYAEEAFDRALEFYKKAGVKLVAAAGDYSLYAEEESYKEFQAAVAKSGLLVIACAGNHELYAKLDVMFGENGYWRTYMNNGIYDGKVEGVLSVADNGIDFTYQIPGIDDSVFISFSQWYWDGHTPAQQKLVEPEQLVWLENQLELHKDKTVYLLFHTYLSDDDYENVDGQGDIKSDGGYSYNGHYNEHTDDEKKFRELLTKYDNIIWYNGHSHYEYSMQEYNENLNIFDYQGTTSTMIHVPSVTNPRTVASGASSYSSLAGKASQGALQFVYDGYQIMNGIDLMSEEILSYACYIIYTDKEELTDGGSIDNEGKLTWTYNAQLNTLRILGEGEIPEYTNNAPWAKYNNDILELYVGKNITTIGKGSFSSLTNLSKAELKEGLTSIGENAFAGTSIQTLILPESLSTIANNAFATKDKIASAVYGGSAEKWKEIKIGTGNEKLSDNISFGKVKITFEAGNKTVVMDVKYGTSPVYTDLPAKDHADENKHYPFAGWNNGKKTYKPTEVLPKAVENQTYTAVFGNEVDRYDGGNLLGAILKWKLDRKTATLTIYGNGNIPDYSTSADQPWAKYSSEIRKVVVEKGIKMVGRNAFSHLDALKVAIIGENVSTLQMDALAYNENLTEIRLPASLKTIGQGSVYESNNIKAIYYMGTEDQWKTLISNITTMYNTNITGAENIIYVAECKNHIPTDWTYSDKTHAYICDLCHTEFDGEEHTFGEWTTEKEPTATEDGVSARSCVCGKKETNAIPALGVAPDTSAPATTVPAETSTPDAENDDSSNAGLIIVIAIVAVVVIAGAVFFVIKKKKK